LSIANYNTRGWATPALWKLRRRSTGNQQRVSVLADNQINTRLMIEAQFGSGSIISGPHRLDLMRAI
jgi:hypothetical protein